MNDENREKMLRIMAVLGFVVAIILLAWLAVQVVRLLPVGFAKLADIFEDAQKDYQVAVHDEDSSNEDENVVITPDEEEEVEEDVEDEVIEEEVVEEEEEEVESSDATSGSDTGSVTPTPAPVQYKTVVTYKTPVSDPNGYTDLEVKFSAFGYLDSAGRFVPRSEISRHDNGAVQFTVKNIGTRTSSSWDFDVELPNGSSIDSKTQSPLKPQETSTLTVVFGEVDDRGNHSVEVEISGGNDNNHNNNGFDKRLSVD